MYGIRQTGFSLEEYWEYVQVEEGSGYGIDYCPQADVITAPAKLWEQRERVWFANAIAMAEERLVNDRWLGTPVRRTYFSGAQEPYSNPFYLSKNVRGIGVEKETVVSAGAALTLRTPAPGLVIIDPVVLTVAVTFTNVNELLLYYPGDTKYRIRPSEVTITAGVATVKIPRVRLLKPTYFLNYDTTNTARPDYNNDNYFLTTVDVVRNYLDTSTGFNLVWNPIPAYACSGTSGVVTKQAAAAVIRDQESGAAIVTTQYQTYSVPRIPDYMEINYMRGIYDRYDEIDSTLSRIITAIVHNYIPEEPCRTTLEGRLFFLHDVRPLEPPVNLRLGPSTWGIFEACGMIAEYDNQHNSSHGGML